MTINFDTMPKPELMSAAKKAGIKTSKLSIMQVREALKNHKPVQAAPAKKSTDKKVVKVEKKSTSKMSLAEAWMSENPGKSRKDVLKVFGEKFGLTTAGGSTYFAILKKRLNYKAAKSTRAKKTAK